MKVEGGKGNQEMTNPSTSESNEFIGGEDTAEKMIKELLEEIHNKELMLAKAQAESERNQL